MAFISVSDGGTIFSLDDKENNFNFTNVFTRIIEAYHPPHGDPKKGIVEDPFPRRSFRDYFFVKQPHVKDFFQNTIQYKSLFHTSPYEVFKIQEKNISLTLKCTSTFNDRVFELEKTYRIIGSVKTLIVTYKVINLSAGYEILDKMR